MKLQLHPKVVYRIPRFPIDASLEESWEELKATIADSSRDFYALIKDTAAGDLHALPERTRHTIWKYSNRARYRCVPYGGFAGVGIFDLRGSRGTELVVSASPELHSYTDWSAIGHYDPPVELDSQQLFANTSWYETLGGIRYLTRSKDGYELCDTISDELALEILKGCSLPVTLSALHQRIACKIPLEELRELVIEMIDLQLLFTSAHSHIIGRDYWQQTSYRPAEGSQQYQISTRAYLSGSLPKGLFQHVPELVRRLSDMVTPYQSKPLNDFVAAFRRKFEGRQIPLMQALDPEMGIGYAGLESSAAEDDLIAALAGKRQADEEKASHAETFLKQTLSTSGLQVIRLEELEAGDKPATQPLPLPNTTTLMCSLAGGQLVIDMFGGATATAINGRFSLASEQILQHCRSMCQVEADANPDVLFFDIGYQVGSRIDNVNRRRQLYRYSLSILNYDTSSEPLGLNDIMVSLSGDTVLLWSRKHRKRLIPRMASAYNSSKSDLPVFRFLSDVQHQGIQSFLQLNLSGLIKGFKHQPRVVFKNIIVSAGKWCFKKQELIPNPIPEVAYCRQLLKAAGVGRYFKSGFSDQTLCYDLDSDQDLGMFLAEAQKQTEVEIEESFLGKTAPVIDEMSRSYAAQFVLSYVHHQQIYRGITGNESPQAGPVKLPGTDWLYFEVYCHPDRATALLREKVAPFITQQKELISKWFFIRYQENGPHLRIRFQLNSPEGFQPLLTAFSSLLQREVESGIVSDLLIRPYRPEVQRYGALFIDRVEAHFHQDSECVLQLLQREPSAESRYRHTARLIGSVASAGIFTPEAFSELFARICRSYEREHRLQAPQFAKMNAAFRSFSRQLQPRDTAQESVAVAQLAGSLIATLQAAEQDRRGQLFADLVHMHVNRLFESNQRSHELLIYYFFQKLSLAQKKQNQSSHKPAE